MIIKELLTVREDGVKLYRNYSDAGLYIIQNETGNKYDEAVDVESAAFTYSETDELIEGDEEATTEDLENALGRFGV